MKRWLIGLLIILMSGAALAAGSAAVRKRVQASMLVTGAIVVASDGSVSSYVIDKPEQLPPMVTGLIAESIPRWKFAPTLLDGRPVAAKAKMSVRFVAKPLDDDKYSIGIGGTQFGQDMPGEVITYKDRVAPTYPLQAVRFRISGTVYLLLRVGRQGEVQEAMAEQVNLVVVDNDEEMERWRKVLANSALAAARKWTFNLPTSGEHMNDEYWVARVPVVYGLISGQVRSDDYGKWQPYVPGPEQPVPWIDDPQLLSGTVDALPDEGLHPLEKNGLRLITPPSGA
ncbi:MAG: energy transducer TonB [Rhodanobacter sp.]